MLVATGRGCHAHMTAPIECKCKERERERQKKNTVEMDARNITLAQSALEHALLTCLPFKVLFSPISE